MKLTDNQQIIADDILRYKKNKLASTLALLGLVFNCLYFMILYAFPKQEFYTFEIGFSVVLTLISLLAIFLASEGVKGYNKTFSIVLLVVAAFQILRIFGYPLNGLKNDYLYAAGDTKTLGYFGYYPDSSAFFGTIMIVYLALSAACLIASAVWGWIVAVRLEKFQKRLDNGEVNVDNVIKEMDEEDRRQAENVISEASITESEINLVKEDENA